MVGGGEEHRIHPREREHAVGFGVVRLFAVGGFLKLGVIGFVGERPGRLSSYYIGIECSIGQTAQQAFLEAGADVADTVKLLMDPGIFVGGFVSGEVVGSSSRLRASSSARRFSSATRCRSWSGAVSASFHQAACRFCCEYCGFSPVAVYVRQSSSIALRCSEAGSAMGFYQVIRSTGFSALLSSHHFLLSM